MFRSGTNASSQNTTATVKGKRPLKFQSVVNSMYETDGINLRQYVTLKMNSQEVRLQLDTTWFQGKHVNIWVMLQCVHRTVFAEVNPMTPSNWKANLSAKSVF